MPPLSRHLSFLLNLLRKTNLKTEHLTILLRLSQIEETSVQPLAKSIGKKRGQVRNYLLYLADKGFVTYIEGTVSPHKKSRAFLTPKGLALLKRL